MAEAGYPHKCSQEITSQVVDAGHCELLYAGHVRLALTCLVLLACGSREQGKAGELHVPVEESAAKALPPAAEPTSAALAPWTLLPAEAQRSGDPELGYQALVGNNYVGCGMPRTLFERFVGRTPRSWQLPQRPAESADLPYFVNGYQTGDGTAMVTASCLSCHASMLQGQLIIGLGETRVDFSIDAAIPLRMATLVSAEGDAGIDFRKLIGRVRTIAPYIRTKVIGPNPADAIAAVLFAHRDPETLAWSEAPRLAEPDKDPVPVDVPPWWLLKKKNAMFYTGAGRGDQARIMMTTSALCTDSVAEAREIDAYFPDVRAYLLSLTPPSYPFAIDTARAERGARIFEKRCARCHGSYGPEPSFPNLLISLAEVGTDPHLAIGSAQFAAPYVRWFSESFYGEIARLEPGQGYVAPPLDGIWASAPYFHNASVPTVAAVLNSTERPGAWADLGSRDDYLQDALGFPFASATDEAPGGDDHRFYDTSLDGHGNGGHRYGDSLTDVDRRALLEYLKTL